MSLRSGVESEEFSATAPTIQAIPRAMQAVSAAPIRPSTQRSTDIRSDSRAREPSSSRTLANTAPTSSAPPSPSSGAYCDREPWLRTSGANRVPRKAPSANPASDIAPTMNPCR
jgi:hypothetical protein